MFSHIYNFIYDKYKKINNFNNNLVNYSIKLSYDIFKPFSGFELNIFICGIIGSICFITRTIFYIIKKFPCICIVYLGVKILYITNKKNEK